MRTATARWISAVLALALLVTACSSGGDSGVAEDESDDEEEEEAEDTTGGFSVGSSAAGGFVTAFSSGLSDFDPTVSSAPGLSASHTATATLPADRAVVVVEPTPRGVLGSVGVLSGGDRQAVFDAAAGLGIPAEAVNLSGRATYGGTRVQADLPVQAVATTGQQFVDAVEKALGRAEASGVVFGLSDCGDALSSLRREAFQGAEAIARRLAESGALRLGPIVALAQQVGRSAFPSFARADPCKPGSTDPSLVELQPVDSRAEVGVAVTVYGTWSIGNPPATPAPRSELSALGRGSETVKADEGYVVVVYADEDGEGELPSRRDRDRLIEAITKLGVSKGDIDIATGSDYGPVTIVQVETRLSDLDRRGDQIEKAVEDVLGRPDLTGVRFWHSDCAGLLAKARKEAVGDARSRAGALAEASGTRLGDLGAVAEGYGQPGLDPCDEDASALLALEDYAAAVQPLDATPEFTVETGIRLAFALG